MGKNKPRPDDRRHSSATPQRPKQLLQNIVDLTKTDPGTRRGQSVAPVPKPTPLSPGFGRPRIIDVPRDPKSNPAYIFQQLALSRNRANVRRNFISTLSPGDTINDDTEDLVETPTPDQKEVKERKEKRKKKKAREDKEEKKAKEGKEKKAKQDKEKKSREGKKSRMKKKEEPEVNQVAEVETASRKRKREDDEADQFKHRVEAEANAVKKLRESLPTIRIARVTRKLERDTGVQPTEMAVILTAAKETIIDLARQQVMQTERSCQTIQTELVRLMKEQSDRLEKLQGKQRNSHQAQGETSEDDDSSEDDQGEPSDAESDASSSEIDDNLSPQRNLEHMGRRCQSQVQ